MFDIKLTKYSLQSSVHGAAPSEEIKQKFPCTFSGGGNGGGRLEVVGSPSTIEISSFINILRQTCISNVLYLIKSFRNLHLGRSDGRTQK